jgi:hypothetical protein
MYIICFYTVFNYVKTWDMQVHFKHSVSITADRLLTCDAMWSCRLAGFGVTCRFHQDGINDLQD